MNKQALLLMLILLAIPLVSALQECYSPIDPTDIPCNIISTYDFEGDCSNHTVMIYDDTPSLLETREWGNYGIVGRCNTTFNYTEGGSYTINSTEGSTATIIVNQKYAELYLYIGAFLIWIIFIIFGYITEQNIFPILAGMLSVAIGIHLAIDGFPNLTNPFLKNGIMVIILGLGFWLMIAPSLKVIEEWR